MTVIHIARSTEHIMQELAYDLDCSLGLMNFGDVGDQPYTMSAKILDI